MTYLPGHMYRQNSEKALLGGGGGAMGGNSHPASLERRIIHKVLGVQKNAR